MVQILENKPSCYSQVPSLRKTHPHRNCWQLTTTLFHLKKIFFTWLCQVLFAACRFFSYSMWDLVSGPNIEPRPPALGAWSLNHCTIREVPKSNFFCLYDVLNNIEAAHSPWKINNREMNSYKVTFSSSPLLLRGNKHSWFKECSFRSFARHILASGGL